MSFLSSSILDQGSSQMFAHQCDRKCDGPALICDFTLLTRAQYTDHDGRRADGVKRSVLTFNGLLPGPTLVVCEGDTVQVELINNIVDGPISNADGSTSTTTLHFHGIREVGRVDQEEKVFGPWSDGVPYVNQCPIETNSTFHYTFIATRNNFNAPPGTYWYHSHVGAQRTNGLQGALVIKPRIKGRKRPTVIDKPRKYTTPCKCGNIVSLFLLSCYRSDQALITNGFVTDICH